MRPPAFRPELLKSQPVCIKLIENVPSRANQPEPMTAKRIQHPEAVLPFDPSVANGVTRLAVWTTAGPQAALVLGEEALIPKAGIH
jgi:hypothetical protein